MNIQNNRIATITRLAEKSSQLGRTALMKYFYFLQTLRRVPLGYSFSLYSYGPFDSDVLADLDATEAVGGVESQIVYYPGGYGYRIVPGAQTQGAKRWGADFLKQHETDIDWVIAEFGGLSSAQLELASTIIYSDREAIVKSEHLTASQLAQRVHDAKPHFSLAQILGLLQDLDNRGLLKSLKSPRRTAMA
jgi:uncharacterized protein